MSGTPQVRKLGRLPRKYLSRVPHMSSLVEKGGRINPPPECTYTRKIPNDSGMMMNDVLGDCTCAAFYHARQTWSVNVGGNMITESDDCVKQLYKEACGYVEGDPSTDMGGYEQDVLTYLYRQGAPVGDGTTSHKITAFVEVDKRIDDDIKQAIHDCGLVYIGFSVPSSVLPMNGDPPKVWDVDENASDIVGGHAVILNGYNSQNMYDLISWGGKYQMTDRFKDRYVDEIYAICDSEWFNATGQSLLGMSPRELQEQMRYFR